jgi:thioredoxin reductase (NADPH)
VSEIRNVIIIGSGPAGYTAAIYAARADLNPLVFEGAVTAGGALMNTTEVENFPGFPTGIQGPELMGNLRAQAERFGAELVPDDVTTVDLTGDVKRVWTGEERYGGRTEHTARAVIVATGSAYRRLGVPGEDELSGHGVSWCATCDGFFFRDQDIAVVGGGDSAVEEATFLSRFARSVTLVHRRDTLRASKIMQTRALNDPKLSVAWNSRPVEVLGTGGKVSGLLLEDTVTAQQRTLPVTGVFVAVGHEPRTELVKGQVGLDEAGYIRVASPATATNLAGVFACGDVVDHVYRQAITAAGTGCSAALDAERYLAAFADGAAPSGGDRTDQVSVAPGGRP